MVEVNVWVRWVMGWDGEGPVQGRWWKPGGMGGDGSGEVLVVERARDGDDNPSSLYLFEPAA